MGRDLLLPRADTEIVCTDAGAGPAVVLLHAGGERRHVWEPVAARLARAGFRSVAVDQRGHGESGGCADRLVDFVDDACALIDRLDTPVVMVGCSLGGFVALLAGARKAPLGQVAGVVLVDVVPDPNAELARTYLKILQMASKGRAWNWALVEDILSQQESLRAAAAASQVPIALVRGELGLVSEKDVARLRALVPSLSVRSVEGAGHLIARDQPELLSDVLVALLRSLPLPGWGPR